MGIKGIKALIKKHAPDAITDINLRELSGKRVCIDSSILLYKYRFTYPDENFHIIGFLNKVIELLNYNINVIFVFDGKPPEAKRETLNKRRETNTKLKENLVQLKDQLKTMNVVDDAFIDSDNESETEEVKKYRSITKKIVSLEKNVKTVNRQHSLEVMELLKSIGIPFFAAESEAEKACVFLQIHKYVDYIITEDTDSLTFGGEKIIFSKKNEYFLCDLQKVLKGLELTHSEFVDLCILCGCDYTGTIPKVGPVTALQVIKKHRSIENYISLQNNIPESFNYKLAQELFKVDEPFEQIDFNYSKDRIKFIEILNKWNLPTFITKISFDDNSKFQFNFNLI